MADYPDERYRRDPHFAALVDMLHNTIKKADFTPTEIREALMLAQIQYEAMNVRPIMLSTDLLRQLGMKTHRETWADKHPDQVNNKSMRGLSDAD